MTTTPATEEGLRALVEWLRQESADEVLCGRPNKAAKLSRWADDLAERLVQVPPAEWVKEAKELAMVYGRQCFESISHKHMDDALDALLTHLALRPADKPDTSAGVAPCRARKTTTGWYCDCMHPEPHCKPFATDGVAATSIVADEASNKGGA
jgi:hypothetical protein